VLSSIWAKVLAAGGVILGLLLAVLKLINIGKQSERRRNEAVVERAKAEAIKDVRDVESNVTSLDPDERRERLRKYASDPE